MNCIFCDIIERKEKAEIIFEDDKAIAFLDINPLNHGHTLVIPKNHYPDFHSVPLNELEKVASVTQSVADAIKRSLKTDGINIVSNNGAAAGQSVYHFHFHIIPRYTADGFRLNPIFKEYGNGQMKIFADKIKSELKL